MNEPMPRCWTCWQSRSTTWSHPLGANGPRSAIGLPCGSHSTSGDDQLSGMVDGVTRTARTRHCPAACRAAWRSAGFRFGGVLHGEVPRLVPTKARRCP
jgi:hypothetical protein